MRLSPEDVVDLKVELWRGVQPKIIAARYGLSIMTISRIKQGAQYASIPWPDGSMGPLPHLASSPPGHHPVPKIPLKELDKHIDGLSVEYNNRLMSILTNVKGQITETLEGDHHQIVLRQIPWEEVLSRASHLKVVQAADSEGDLELKGIVATVIAGLGNGQLIDEQVQRLVRDVLLLTRKERSNNQSQKKA